MAEKDKLYHSNSKPNTLFFYQKIFVQFFFDLLISTEFQLFILQFITWQYFPHLLYFRLMLYSIQEFLVPNFFSCDAFRTFRLNSCFNSKLSQQVINQAYISSASILASFVIWPYKLISSFLESQSSKINDFLQNFYNYSKYKYKFAMHNQYIFFFLFLLLSSTLTKITVLETITNVANNAANLISSAFSTDPKTSSSNSISRTSYNQKEAEKCARLSSISYCKTNCIQNWSCGSAKQAPYLVNTKYYEHPDSLISHYQGYQLSTKTLYISWRGTENPVNWLQNIAGVVKIPFKLLKCTQCFIHSGMYVGYESNKVRLNENTKQIMKHYSVERIVITGHSLGGALSIINGLDYSEKFPKVPLQIYTFGSPRLGNSRLNDLIESKLLRLFRVVYYKDIVPHLPPTFIGVDNFEQPKGEIFYGQKMQNPKHCPNRQDFSCSRFYSPGYNIEDHRKYFIGISYPKC